MKEAMYYEKLDDLYVRCKLCPHYCTIGLAFTYNEPSIFYEYMLDMAKKTHEKGLKNIIVTNGYINEEPLREILPYIDAMNIG